MCCHQSGHLIYSNGLKEIPVHTGRNYVLLYGTPYWMSHCSGRDYTDWILHGFVTPLGSVRYPAIYVTQGNSYNKNRETLLLVKGTRLNEEANTLWCLLFSYLWHQKDSFVIFKAPPPPPFLGSRWVYIEVSMVWDIHEKSCVKTFVVFARRERIRL